MNEGRFELTLARFRGIRLFERNEQNFRHIRNFFLKKTKKTSDWNRVGVFYYGVGDFYY